MDRDRDTGRDHPTQFRTGPQVRTSVSLTDLRTPIVDNFLSMLPMGHEKAIKYGFYNVIALISAAGIMVAFWGVYCILEPFIKSLMWATLCGSVLHPFKEQLCLLARTWLKSVKKSSAPFTFKVMISPIIIADSVSEKVGYYVWKYWKYILLSTIAFVVTYVIYYNPPVTIVSILQYIGSCLLYVIAHALSWINGSVVISLNLGYLIAVGHFVATRKKNLRESSAQTTVKDHSSYEDSLDNSSKDKVKDAAEDFLPGDSDVQRTQLRNLTETHSLSKNLKIISYVSWTVTVAYVWLRLPYAFLIALAVFIATGASVYFKNQKEKSFRYSLPKISRMACMMVLNIGADDSINKRSRSISQIVSPIAGRFRRSSPNPGVSSSRSRLRRSGNESLNKTPLHRSFSEGSSARGFPVVEEDDLVNPNDQQNPIEMPSPIMSLGSSNTEDEVDGHGVDSNMFLYGVFCACLVVFVWNHLWLMHLVPIPVAYYGVKKLSSRFGLMDYLSEKVIQPVIDSYREYDEENNVIVPEPVKIVFRILKAGDRKFISICEAYVDPVASLLVVVLVVMATIVGLIFAATQVYAEGDHLVSVAKNLINSTVSQHPEINELLPEGWQSVMNSVVGNAYHYGREYITNMIRNSVSETNPEKAEQVEKEVIELWDRIYVTWNQTWENALTNVTKIHDTDPNLSDEHQGIEWNELLEKGKEMPHLLELSVLADYAKANVGTLWTIMDALWNILVGNVSLAISAVTSVLSLVFGGGTAILNLIINLVVFFTALFYLLSASTSVYKPVELFNQFSPGSGVHTNRFALAVEEAVNGVFVASFKMAAFYGMWTWLIHTLFQVNIVFVPSIFGGLFAAVPFLMPYWAALPAVLELWLLQGHWPKALCMLLAQMAPMSAVDTQIYSEIKGGGHPYLTGLAVAGGIFCFGVQGAIMGPVILCFVFVAIKVGNSFMWEGTDRDLLVKSQHLRRHRDYGDRMDGDSESQSYRLGQQKQDSSISSQ